MPEKEGFLPEEAAPSSNVARAGKLILQDIARRGLSPGQPYLTAQEAARQFGLTPQMVSRAMKSLAERGLLVRKAGVGTFVGPGFRVSPSPGLSCVHVVLGPDLMKGGFPTGELVDGLVASLKGLDLRLDFLPQEKPASRMGEVLVRGKQSEDLGGLVLVGCPREVQERVLMEGLPAVVFGSVYATTWGLPSLDADLFRAGEIMVDHLARKGHEKIALFLHDRWLPGHHKLLEGIHQGLSRHGLPPSALLVRSLPVDSRLVALEARALLEGPGAPRAVMGHGSFFSFSVRDAARSLGLEIGKDLDLVSDTRRRRPSPVFPWPYVCPILDLPTQAGKVGEILRERMAGPTGEVRHEVIPVELVE